MVTAGLLAPLVALLLIVLGAVAVIGFNRLSRLMNEVTRSEQRLDEALAAGDPDQVAAARQLHGLAVELYNSRRRAFPEVMVAGMLGFAPLSPPE